jgi:hypothetical protein
MKALLVLGRGDTPYSDRNRLRLVKSAKIAGFDVQQADYHEIERVPRFRNETINVMPFFPFTFWNANCEVPEDTRLYGTSRLVYEKFRGHFLQVQGRLEQKFRGQKLHYVIPPENAPVDRDKVETINRLRACGVPTSEPVPYDSLRDILDHVTREQGVFIKCRYGAEGKGIAVLHHDRWVTNYKVERDGLTNYGVYDPWRFTNITGREDLLGQLLQHEVIVEREISTPDVFDGKKFDLRAYVIGQDVPHFFVRLNDPRKEVTNFSQGAIIKHHPDTGLTETCLRLARRIAKQAAEAMGLGFVGVDIMFDGRLSNPKVVEAQAFADFPDITKFDLVKYIVSNTSGLFI